MQRLKQTSSYEVTAPNNPSTKHLSKFKLGEMEKLFALKALVMMPESRAHNLFSKKMAKLKVCELVKRSARTKT